MKISSNKTVLPYEIWELILKFVCPRSLYQLSRVSKNLSKITKSYITIIKALNLNTLYQTYSLYSIAQSDRFQTIQHFVKKSDNYCSVLRVIDNKYQSESLFAKVLVFEDPVDFFNKYSDLLRNYFAKTVILSVINSNKFDIRRVLDKNSLICSAAIVGDYKLIQEVMTFPSVDPSSFSNIAICFASRLGCYETVKLLLSDNRVDPSAWNNTPLCYASENGHHEIIQLLLKYSNVDPSVDSNRCIRWACRNNHTKVVNLLLQHPKVDPTMWNNYAIVQASKNGNLNIVKNLLNVPGVDPFVDDAAPMRLALQHGHEELYKYLVDHTSLEVK